MLLLARYARSAAITNEKLSASLNGSSSDFKKLGVAYKLHGAQDLCAISHFSV